MELTRAVLRLSGASMGQPCCSLGHFWGLLGRLGVLLAVWGSLGAVRRLTVSPLGRS